MFSRASISDSMGRILDAILSSQDGCKISPLPLTSKDYLGRFQFPKLTPWRLAAMPAMYVDIFFRKRDSQRDILATQCVNVDVFYVGFCPHNRTWRFLCYFVEGFL
jgi:hypothetical protein